MRRVIVPLLLVALLSAPAVPVSAVSGGPISAGRDEVTLRTRGFGNQQVRALARTLARSHSGLPGGAVAGLWVPGKGMWVGAVGKADIARKRPMRPALQIPVGSVTKTFTGTLVLQEVQRGRLRLEDPMAKWYPRFPKADRITVAMLLNMTSGIADVVNDDIVNVSRQQRLHPKRIWKPGGMIRKAARMPRHFDVPGTQYAYSNTNTVILGQILVKTTGKSLPRLLSRRLYRPLHLRRTLLDLKGRLQPPRAQTYSLLYGAIHGKPPLLRTTGWSLSLEGAAGGIASTLADMRRWARALGTGRGLLSRTMQRSRVRDCADLGSGDGYTASYCLGVATVRETDSGELVTVWHNGRILGATSNVAYYPRTRAVLVVLSNQDGDAPGTEASVPDTVAKQLVTAVPGLLGM